MMVNVDNANSSSVGFGLEDLPLLNNNNNEAEAKSEDDIRSIDKVSFKTDDACPNTQHQSREVARVRVYVCFLKKDYFYVAD